MPKVESLGLQDKFALMLKERRSVLEIDRYKFALSLNISVKFLEKVEHGVLCTQRRLLKKIIRALFFDKKEKMKAMALLNIVCPRKWENRKVHAGFDSRTRKLPHRKIRESLRR